MSQTVTARRQDVRDCSVERLFSELVCLQLHRIMDFGQVHCEADERFARSCLMGGSDDDGYEFERAPEPANFEARLASVESAQLHVTAMLQYIIKRLDSVLPPSAVPVPGVMVPCAQPFVDAGESPSFDSTPLSSASASPNGYAFTCPLCLKPQGTPKSHCEHMRKVAAGDGVCVFNVSIDRHAAILRRFSDANSFVKWYIKSLRSGTGRDYTDQDVRDHADLQVCFTIRSQYIGSCTVITVIVFACLHASSSPST
jgi:hypothetical protein